MSTPSPTTWAFSDLVGLLPIVGRQRRALVLTITSGLFALSLSTGLVALLAWIAGGVASGVRRDLMLEGMALALLCISTALARWWQSAVSHDLAFALIETLQIEVFDGVERSAPATVMGQRSGDIAATAVGDADAMEMFFAHLLGDYVAALAVPLASLVALAIVHPAISLALLPLVPLLLAAPFVLSKRAGEQGDALALIKGRLNAEIVEAAAGIREILAFGRGPKLMARMDEIDRELSVANAVYGRRAGLETGAIELVQTATVVVAASISLWLYTKGELTLEMLPLAVALGGAALLPLSEIGQAARSLGQLRGAAKRLMTIFRQPARIQDTGTQLPDGGDIAFDHVSFAYSRERAPALRGTTFSISQGETVALVGRSGSGKSTCANLLLRLWDVDEGAIRIGNVDIRSMSLASLRQLVSIVEQDVVLFEGTISDNIALGKPDATPGEIRMAAKAAQAHAFISALPDGYDTPLASGGTGLSGGQRQRIAIARALVRNTPVVILDEASSNLDAESEHAFQQALGAIRGSRTLVVIAHRQTTIGAADRVIELSNGAVVGNGL
ncbi:ABC transporter ATP-binding protein [Sphingobium sp. B2D3C]|uniref:ABC transporter ATP-binding protein n=1 Tax=Sphingobium sp. B2D3C TaxID=2940581 RepID=UPI002224F5B0|nr:ABC transporter ATP-binding protein [Sphingobium sp. B2D3C]MCW2397914.1 ATP-binding cassette subfamily C protein CydCD [Sphingobium sp. B2D3C]